MAKITSKIPQHRRNDVVTKENNKKVSIITTFYNAQNYVLSAINSINAQNKTGINYEYILVDDKSQDETRKLIEKYIDDNVIDKENWKIIEPEQNLGCGGARRFGIEHATGDYFMFLDADDYYINSDFVKRAITTLESENADVVEFGIIFNHSNGQQSNNAVQQKIVIDNPDIAEIALFKDNIIKFNVWSKIYRREIVESYRYSDSRTFEDVRTIPRWIHNAKKIVIMPTVEINYRAANNSIIREDNVKTRLGTITAIAELFEEFKNNYNILKAMYGRAMVDLEAILHNHSSKDPGYREMCKLNTKMLMYLYPNEWQNLTFNIEDWEKEEEIKKQLQQMEMNPEEINLDDIPGWDMPE